MILRSRSLYLHNVMKAIHRKSLCFASAMLATWLANETTHTPKNKNESWMISSMQKIIQEQIWIDSFKLCISHALIFEHSSVWWEKNWAKNFRKKFFILLVLRKIHSIQYHCHTRSSRRFNEKKTFFLAFQCCHLFHMKMAMKAYTRTNTNSIIPIHIHTQYSWWRIRTKWNCANHAKRCRTLRFIRCTCELT